MITKSRRTNYFDETEGRLGLVLQNALTRDLGANPEGAALLKVLSGPDMKPRLPEIVVLNIDPRYGAFYVPGRKLIALNSSDVVNSILNHIPDEKRSSVRSQISVDKGLAEYLLSNPAAIDDFIKDNDVTLFHELVHYGQDQSRSFLAAQLAQSVPSMILIENEYEAYFRQNLFFHAKLKADPEAGRHPQGSGYLKLLMGYDGWLDFYNQAYASNWPSMAADLLTAEALQQENSWLREKLTLGRAPDVVERQRLASSQGFEVIRAEQQHAVALKESIQELLPSLQREGFRLWSEASGAIGRKDQALAGLQHLVKILPSGEEREKTVNAAYQAAVNALLWLPQQKGMTLDERVNLLNSVIAAYDEARQPWEREVWEMRRSLYAEAAQHYRILAQSRTDATLRVQDIKRAEGFENALQGDRAQLRTFAETNLAQLKAEADATTRGILLQWGQMQAEILGDRQLIDEFSVASHGPQPATR